MRVVIDTNIWVSGLLWRGAPSKLLRLAEQGDIELCMAPAMLNELGRVLSYERLQPRLEQLELTPAELVASPPIELWPEIVVRVPMPEDVEEALLLALRKQSES
jgi:putative PIN family toxin of toxin-antitoxin system